MGEKKKITNLLLMIILIVIIVGLLIVCFSLVHKLNADGIKNDSKYNYDVSSRTIPQVVDAGFISALVDTKGNAYIYSNHKMEYHNDIKERIANLESKYQAYNPHGYSDDDGNTTLKAIKLNISDVLSVYYVLDNTSSYFIFIRKNGNISYTKVSFIYEDIIDIKDIPELTNIVAIIDNDYKLIPYAITSDGKEILLSDYLK